MKRPAIRTTRYRAILIGMLTAGWLSAIGAPSDTAFIFSDDNRYDGPGAVNAQERTHNMDALGHTALRMQVAAATTQKEATAAGQETCIADSFETGVSNGWDVTHLVTHQLSPGGGAAGSAGYVSIAGGGGLGESFADISPGGASDWSITCHFRWSATGNRKFAVHVGTSETAGAAATINLKYDDADGWAAYDGGEWVSIAALAGSKPANDQWHRITLDGYGWGSTGADYDIAVVEYGGETTTAIGLTIFHNGNPMTDTAGAFFINAVYGNNPGFDVDNVVASREVRDTSQAKVISISGVYPHLAMTSANNEVGPGAIVPWADRLWVLTYGPHLPNGSDDKLYEIDAGLVRITRPESIGGTPANRMIHDESAQLIMGPYFIDTNRTVTAIPYASMPGRHTANARHLSDPDQKVYVFTMEDGLYELDVETKAVTTIYPDVQGNGDDHLHGYHAKGAYSGQGLLVVANNGRNWNTGDPTGASGVLATWNGSLPHAWNELLRVQHCEVTGPGGLHGNSNPATDPIWATGFDVKSVVLRTIENGIVHTWRLPKGSYTHDGSHGWYTEWPRIRKLDDGDPRTRDRWLMHMHGVFFDFPEAFSSADFSGLAPICAYYKMPVDYCMFNGQLVIGKNDASKFDNAFVPRAQSNLWFGDPSHLTNWGVPHGHGGVWLDNDVAAGAVSEPFLVNGFSRITLHLTHTTSSGMAMDIETSGGLDIWRSHSTVAVPTAGAGGYAYVILNDLAAEWIRLRARDAATDLTAYYLLANPYPHPHSATNDYADLAGITQTNDYSDGLIRVMAGSDLALEYASRETGRDGVSSTTAYHRIGGAMRLEQVTNAVAEAALRTEIVPSKDFGVDRASAWIMDGTERLRLPRLHRFYDTPFASGWARGFREAVTERSLLNCHGTFYEIPRDSSGGRRRMKPLATHGKRITDFASWRGLFVLTGVRTSAVSTNHVYGAYTGNAALWLGEIDDVWRMGEPRGVGGPWKHTAVTAGAPSDAYLMYGYDRKELTLSHSSGAPVTFTVEVDFLGSDRWSPYGVITVPAGESLTHRFPTGYQAHWVRVSVDVSTTATAQFVYGSAEAIEEPQSESVAVAEYDFNGGSAASIDTHADSIAGDYTVHVGAISSLTYSHYATPSTSPTRVASFTVTADAGELNLARLVVPLLATDDGDDSPTYDFAIRASVDAFASDVWAGSVQVPGGDNQVATVDADVDLSGNEAFQNVDTVTFAIFFSSPDSAFGYSQRVISSLSGTGATAINGASGPFTAKNVRIDARLPSKPGTVLTVK